MKNLFSLIVILFSLHCFGQAVSANEILAAAKEEKMAVYKPKAVAEKQLYLYMDYGSPDISNAAEIKDIKNAKVMSVDVVYSDYPAGKGFPALTKQRIENLKKLKPELFAYNSIEWRFIRQTACKDKTAAQGLFHGLSITYRPAQSEAEMAKEIKYLKDFFTTSAPAPERSTSTKVTKATHKAGASKAFSGETGSDSLIIVYSPESKKPIGIAISGFGAPYAQDSTVFKVLKRNRWNKMAITADLTGSMSPYTAQLLMWFKLNTTNNKVKQFVFFNDGNRTPDSRKVIGKTGGIYDTKSAKFEDVNELALKTMRAGGGGDGPENNIEALLKTIELCPDCENLVMIADNWAPVKDISLLSQVKKPVKVILCGAYFGVNVEYLNLAKATGGSVHTMEQDLTELVRMKEGEEIKIGAQTFKIVKGKFVLITKV